MHFRCYYTGHLDSLMFLVGTLERWLIAWLHRWQDSTRSLGWYHQIGFMTTASAFGCVCLQGTKLHLLCGITLLVLGLTLLIVDPISIYAKFHLRMDEGTLMYSVWENPPIGLYVRNYIFNITNSEQFLAGEAKTIKLEEVGPFTYLEKRTNKNITIDHGKGVLRFLPHRQVRFVPELSIGDPNAFTLAVPNVPLLAISSMVSENSFVKKTPLNLLTKTLKSKSVISLTAQEYLWGYQDSLVRMANTILPEWISFAKFGILDRMYDDAEVTMEVELADEAARYSIRSLNGSAGLVQWGYNNSSERTTCNSLQGAYEGILFSPGLTYESKPKIFNKQICRTLPLEYSGESTTEFGVKGLDFKVSRSTYYNTPDNRCMCKGGKCLMEGLSDLSPCFYDLPLAVSWPHFRDADPIVYNKIEGMKPDLNKHDSKFTIEPVTGVPLSMASSTQINVVIGDVDFSSAAQPFSNTVLPIFWSKVELQDIQESDRKLLLWLLVYGPWLMMATQVLLFISGILILVYLTYMSAKSNTIAKKSKEEICLTDR